MRTTETPDFRPERSSSVKTLLFAAAAFFSFALRGIGHGILQVLARGDASWIRLRRSWSRLHEVADEQRRLVECLLAGRTARNPKEELLRIPKFALDILVCPLCKTRVELLADESGLKCVSCRRVYPIRDDIPVMLPEEATIAEENRNT